MPCMYEYSLEMLTMLAQTYLDLNWHSLINKTKWSARGDDIYPDTQFENTVNWYTCFKRQGWTCIFPDFPNKKNNNNVCAKNYSRVSKTKSTKLAEKCK